MVKSVYSVSHKGLRDWVVQRVSAVVVAAYSIWLLAYLFLNPDLSFAQWHALFSSAWVKIFSLLFILSLLLHAWVGMWTIFTDYIKCFAIRCVLNVVVLLGLAAVFLWGWLILWSV